MSEQTLSKGGIVYLRLEQVMERTALSKSSIYDKMNPSSPRHDPHFPTQVKLGLAAVRWVSSEVEGWLASRVRTNGVPVDKTAHATKSNEIQTTTHRNPEETAFTVAELKKQRIVIVHALLEKHAKRGENLFYKDVMMRTMLSPEVPGDCKIIDQLLEDISRESHTKNNVLLSALVFEEFTGKRRPKKAFFDLAKSLGYTCDDPEIFVENQIFKLYELYEDPAAKSKGKLYWMQIRNKMYLHRSG